MEPSNQSICELLLGIEPKISKDNPIKREFLDQMINETMFPTKLDNFRDNIIRYVNSCVVLLKTVCEDDGERWRSRQQLADEGYDDVVEAFVEAYVPRAINALFDAMLVSPNQTSEYVTITEDVRAILTTVARLKLSNIHRTIYTSFINIFTKHSDEQLIRNHDFIRDLLIAIRELFGNPCLFVQSFRSDLPNTVRERIVYYLYLEAQGCSCKTATKIIQTDRSDVAFVLYWNDLVLRSRRQ
jgi:hypothetical protein